ncbi:MAG: hypothetical protein ACYC4R_13875 [Anaerolineae bacterium]
MAKTVIGVYDDRSEAERVVQTLVDEGFSRNDVSLMVRQAGAEADDGQRGRGNKAGEGAGIGAGIGAVLGGAGGLLVGLGLLAIPGIGPVLAAGPLAAALAGAGIGAGAGALVGALVGLGIPEQEAEFYAEAVRRGSTLVAVHAQDEMARHASQIMGRFNAVDIEDRAASWKAEGWMPARAETPEAGRGDAAARRDIGERVSTSVQEGQGIGISGLERSGTSSGMLRPVPIDDIGESQDYSNYDNAYRRHFLDIYGSSSHDFSYYEPAYHFGSDLALSNRFRDRDWGAIEADARTRWEQENSGTWEDVRDAIRRGFNVVRGERELVRP